jgi:hypothetical protein
MAKKDKKDTKPVGSPGPKPGPSGPRPFPSGPPKR